MKTLITKSIRAPQKGKKKKQVVLPRWAKRAICISAIVAVLAIITGIILFFIIGSEFFINYRLEFRKHDKEEVKA